MLKSITERNAELSALSTAMVSGTVQLRTGAGAGPDNAATGTLLATFTLDATPFAAPSNGSMAMADIPLAVAAAAEAAGTITTGVTTPTINGTAVGSAGYAVGTINAPEPFAASEVSVRVLTGLKPVAIRAIGSEPIVHVVLAQSPTVQVRAVG